LKEGTEEVLGTKRLWVESWVPPGIREKKTQTCRDAALIITSIYMMALLRRLRYSADIKAKLN